MYTHLFIQFTQYTASGLASHTQNSKSCWWWFCGQTERHTLTFTNRCHSQYFLSHSIAVSRESLKNVPNSQATAPVLLFLSLSLSFFLSSSLWSLFHSIFPIAHKINRCIYRWKFCVHADKRQMLLDLTHSLQLHPTKAHVLWELSNCISSAVGADSFRLYLADNGNPDALNLYIGHNGEPKMQKIKSDSHGIPTYVARTREPVRISRGKIHIIFVGSLSFHHYKWLYISDDQDARFPGSFEDEVSVSVMHDASVWESFKLKMSLKSLLWILYNIRTIRSFKQTTWSIHNKVIRV